MPSRQAKRPGAAAAWHFLTGDHPSIDRLTRAAGFRYVWDKDTKRFAHPSGVIVLTPDGRLGRYLFGIEYSPRDLRYAIVEAWNVNVGSAVDALLLYCFHYDPMTGRYGVAIIRVIRLNPWGALGLDWTTTSPPPTGNFAETPIVTWGAYEYEPPPPQRDVYSDGSRTWLQWRVESMGTPNVTCCAIVAAIRPALFLACSAIVPLKRSSTVV